MTTQPEALRLADRLETWTICETDHQAAFELRRLHVLTEELQENLEKKSIAIQRIWKERDELRTENEALREKLNKAEESDTESLAMYHRARDRADAAQAAVETLRADAERYRWLREESGKRPDVYSGETSWMVSRAQGGMGQNFFGEKIDAAIDAAREQT